MSETVVVRKLHWKTDCYHTEECYNAKRISKRKEIPKDKAEDLGLHECHKCAGKIHRERNHNWEYYRSLTQE